jgi:hypothetical protein
MRIAPRNRQFARPRPVRQSQVTPASQKEALKRRVELSARALKDADLDNMTTEQRLAAGEYIHAVERLEQEYGYIVTFSGVESLKRALAK